jgi:hypothetical protein
MVPDEVEEDREAFEIFGTSGPSVSGFDGSTSLIVEVLALPWSSGRAGNLGSSLIVRLVRVGVDGEVVVCEKRDDRDGEIEDLKLASVSSSDETVVLVDMRLLGRLRLCCSAGGYNPSSAVG